jgi:hypothetical protein
MRRLIWVLGMIGVVLPGMVLKLLEVGFVLIAILVLFRLFLPLGEQCELVGETARSVTQNG